MKKLFSIAVLILFSQFQVLNAIAGSDGQLEISSKKNNQDVKDCFESVNRGIFAFNQGLDKVIFKPLAKGYRKLPQPVRSGTSNALSNLGNLVTIPNNILQGQIKDASINSLRLIINSTLGIVGIFDVASYYGLQKLEKEDYGQTLGTWGVGEGCYFVLPVLGPTTVRDSIGSLANATGGDAWYNVTVANDTRYFNEADYYLTRLLSGIDFRAKNLESLDSLENTSIDLYASIRSLYLQDRQRKIKNLDESTETMSDDDWNEID
ncbi:MAG TPA: VacJ family lipoprotein [Candidatus Pelagibacter bacterium]|jgi:phospholipid-binding lipoprotein MlaA|nr:VacJ family lipoprotein [Candidatus Pelagibacter bacterium]